MPTTYTAPGVYIEEVPSGVRPIAGVATSIAAFVGTAPRGPNDEATRVDSYGDYARIFGGLDASSPLSFAVRQFFDNGGGTALIVRVVRGSTARTIDLTTGAPAPDDKPLSLVASSAGSWGNQLQVVVDHATRDPNDTKLFNLTVQELDENGQVVNTEKFFNLSVSPGDPQFAPRALEQGSSLVRVAKDNGNWKISTTRPEEKTVKTVKAEDASAGKDEKADEPVTETQVKGDENKRMGVWALLSVDIFNLLLIPPLPGATTATAAMYQEGEKLCVRRRAMLLVDAGDGAVSTVPGSVDGLGLGSPPQTRNVAAYYPLLVMTDPLRGGTSTFPPTGAVAGVIARTDAERGVWKAPAGTDAGIVGALDVSRPVGLAESGQLNPLGINCLRSITPFGRVVWGARTLAGKDQLADDYKYLPVRRLALYLEESLYRGTQWVVFEPNDEPLWSQIRLNVGAFMHGLFRQGAFQGTTPNDAYFVKCDKETNPQADINLGIVNIVVGFAPLKPAEFVVIKIQQIAGQIQT
jgi:phage tail sheath protein FI